MPNFKLKILLVGAETKGKNKLIKKIGKNRFFGNYKLTVGVDILTRDIEYERGEVATLSIWDVGSQDRFKSLRDNFYKGSAGALLVFDLSQELTYKELREWFSEINETTGFIPFILIGNTIELMKQTNNKLIREEAREFAEKKGGVYIEVSPEEGDILEEALQDLTRKILEIHTKKKKSDDLIPKMV
ncbi:MAG: Rab family GTPase [Promethearchaeota archaeon]